MPVAQVFTVCPALWRKSGQIGESGESGENGENGWQTLLNFTTVCIATVLSLPISPFNDQYRLLPPCGMESYFLSCGGHELVGCSLQPVQQQFFFWLRLGNNWPLSLLVLWYPFGDTGFLLTLGFTHYIPVFQSIASQSQSQSQHRYPRIYWLSHSSGPHWELFVKIILWNCCK